MRPETRNQRLKNDLLPSSRFQRLWKTLKTWNSFERRCGKTSNSTISKRLQASTKQALDQVFKHLHSFQHAPEQVFCRSLQCNRIAFRRNAQLTWDFPILPPSHCLQSRKCRGSALEQPGISTMSKTFAPPFFTLIRVFIQVFNNL